MAGVTSGTTSRFTAGEISASRPNDARTTGSVAACAASDTPRLSAQPARQSAARQPIQPRRQRRRPGDEPGGRQRRQLEPGVHHERGLREQQQERREPECRGCPPTSPGLAGQQDHAGHRPGAKDRRRGPGEHDVRDDGDGGDDRPSTATESPGHRPDGSRDDGDVPARDRDDVTDARRRERGRHVPVDAVAQSDEDPGGQPGLRFGQHPGQQLARHPGASPRAACRDRPGGRAPPSSARRACPTPRVARGTARTGCRAAVSSVPRRSRDRRARSADSAAAWPQAGTRSGRRPRSGCVATWWPSRGEPTVSTTIDHGPLPVGAPVSAGALGPRPARRAIDSRPTASATTATRRRSSQPQPAEQQDPGRGDESGQQPAIIRARHQGGDRGPGRQPAGPRHLSAP